MARGHGGAIELVLNRPDQPWYKHREAIREAVQSFSMTERWGWTPDYIENMDSHKKMVYLLLLKGVAKVENERAKH